ncbi:MAG: betaine-aldehyde dehydrogenase, partial [Conexibacter sp.]|nr:betaine-aldehyde dehydrogenase [Conexibacter sp.]
MSTTEREITATAGRRAPLRWEYSPAPESTDHVRLRERYGLFIDGEFVEPDGGAYAPTINPATEEPLAQVAQAGAADVARAVAAAR